MARWIELNTGELVNLDNICHIHKFLDELAKPRYLIIFSSYKNPDYGYIEESFDNENDRDKRFEEIKTLLINS